MFNRNGYWVRRSLDGTVTKVLKVVNDYDDYEYVGGEWIVRDKICGELGVSDDWDKVTEEEALEIINRD